VLNGMKTEKNKILEIEKREIRDNIKKELKIVNRVIVNKVKDMDDNIKEMIRSEYKKHKIGWKKYIFPLMKLRYNLLKFRKEKWIKTYLRENELEYNEETWNKKGIIYIRINLINRWIYIGQTEDNIYSRSSSHLSDYKKFKKRPQYKKMKEIGIEEWIIIPIMEIKNNSLRLSIENSLINKYKKYISNDRRSYVNKYSNNMENKEVKKITNSIINESKAHNLEIEMNKNNEEMENIKSRSCNMSNNINFEKYNDYGVD
jgi:hypothetical protein